MSKQMKTKDILLGSFIGGALGASFALLFAPRSGKSIRADITQQASNVKERAEEWRGVVKEFGTDLTLVAKEKAKNVASQSAEMVDKLKPEDNQEEEPQHTDEPQDK